MNFQLFAELIVLGAACAWIGTTGVYPHFALEEDAVIWSPRAKVLIPLGSAVMLLTVIAMTLSL